jgi:molybdopterin synthase sulfur carrier subunit
MIELRYFAWLRERIGADREMIRTDAATIADLIAELRGKSDAHNLVFSDLSSVRAAVDQELVDLDHPVQGAREIAFFPPMTGG